MKHSTMRLCGLLVFVFAFFSMTSEIRAQLLKIEQPVRFLALGNSYTIGHSVVANGRWPNQLRDSLEARSVTFDSLKIIAKTGWTTDDLQNGIRTSPLEPNWNLVGLLIGVNNQYQGSPISQYYQEFPALLDSAILLAGGDKERVFVVSIPDYAFTSFGQNANPDLISTELDNYNRINDSITRAYGVRYFNITPISRQGVNDPTLVAADGLHPSKKQYTKWVELMLPAFDSSLAVNNPPIGISPVSQQSVKAFADSNNGTLHFLGMKQYSNHVLELKDFSGRIVHSQPLTGEQKVVVQSKNWSKGALIWVITNSKNEIQESGKLMVQ